MSVVLIKKVVLIMNNVFDENVEIYDEWFEINNNILDSEVEAIRQLIPATMLKMKRTIEIGAGTGIFAQRLGICHALEPSLQMGAKARQRGIEVFEGIAENMDIPDRSYDMALMVTVDCFLNDIKKSLTEIWRILADDGIFIIAFIDKETKLGKIYEKNKETNQFYRNANFHSSREILTLLSESGFDVLDKRQTIYDLNNQLQEIKKGFGDGVFAVIKAVKNKNKEDYNE